MARKLDCLLDECLSFDFETGKAFWKKSIGGKSREGQEAGYTNSDGYVCVTIEGITYGLHRLIWFAFYKRWPQNMLDHIDRNPSNNTITNLREADASLNGHNASVGIRNKTGVKGVSFDPAYKLPYRVSINKHGKLLHKSNHSTLEEAKEKAAEIYLTLGSK